MHPMPSAGFLCGERRISDAGCLPPPHRRPQGERRGLGHWRAGSRAAAGGMPAGTGAYQPGRRPAACCSASLPHAAVHCCPHLPPAPASAAPPPDLAGSCTFLQLWSPRHRPPHHRSQDARPGQASGGRDAGPGAGGAAAAAPLCGLGWLWLLVSRCSAARCSPALTPPQQPARPPLCQAMPAACTIALPSRNCHAHTLLALPGAGEATTFIAPPSMTPRQPPSRSMRWACRPGGSCAVLFQTQPALPPFAFAAPRTACAPRLLRRSFMPAPGPLPSPCLQSFAPFTGTWRPVQRMSFLYDGTQTSEAAGQGRITAQR